MFENFVCSVHMCIELFSVSLVVPQIPTHCPPSSGSGPTSPQAKRRQIGSPGKAMC